MTGFAPLFLRQLLILGLIGVDSGGALSLALGRCHRGDCRLQVESDDPWHDHIARRARHLLARAHAGRSKKSRAGRILRGSVVVIQFAGGLVPRHPHHEGLLSPLAQA